MLNLLVLVIVVIVVMICARYRAPYIAKLLLHVWRVIASQISWPHWLYYFCTALKVRSESGEHSELQSSHEGLAWHIVCIRPLAIGFGRLYAAFIAVVRETLYKIYPIKFTKIFLDGNLPFIFTHFTAWATITTMNSNLLLAQFYWDQIWTVNQLSNRRRKKILLT